MTMDEFKHTLKDKQPPKDCSSLLRALWHDRKGDWDHAHKLAQDVSSKDGSRVHAYLHRKEGNEGNAGYWYKNASQGFCRENLEKEWEDLVSDFLSKASE